MNQVSKKQPAAEPTLRERIEGWWFAWGYWFLFSICCLPVGLLLLGVAC